MKRASALFSDSQRNRINESVRDAEAKTSVEIVPVVATVSGRYDRAEDIIGLWLGILLILLIAIYWPSPIVSTESGSWDADPSLVQAAKYIMAMLLGFVLGAIGGSRIYWLRRLFTPAQQMTDETRQAAQAIFFDQRIHHTKSESGFLIYVSLFERTAVVFADRTVLEAVGQGVLDELCRSLTENLRCKDPTEAICETVYIVGEKLRGVLPLAEKISNELPDSLVTID